MASIQKKGEIYYLLERVKSSDAKWKTKWIKLGRVPYSKAVAARARFENDKTYLRVGIQVDASLTIKDLIDDYEQNQKDFPTKKPETRTRQVSLLRNLQKKFGTTKVSSFDCEAVNFWLKEKKYAPNTVRLYIQAIRMMYKLALQRRDIEIDPTLKLHQPKILKQPPRYAAHEDILKVLDCLGKDSAPFMFMYYAGLRPSEAVRLQVKNIDLEAACIDLYPDQTKTAERGILPLHKALSPLARKLIIQAKKTKTNYLFPFGDGHQKKFRKSWDAACKKAGIELTPYQLRHSYATRLLSATGDIRTVQQLMRHTDIRMTTRYATAIDSRLRDAIDKL